MYIFWIEIQFLTGSPCARHLQKNAIPVFCLRSIYMRRNAFFIRRIIQALNSHLLLFSRKAQFVTINKKIGLAGSLLERHLQKKSLFSKKLKNPKLVFCLGAIYVRENAFFNREKIQYLNSRQLSTWAPFT